MYHARSPAKVLFWEVRSPIVGVCWCAKVDVRCISFEHQSGSELLDRQKALGTANEALPAMER